MNAERDGVLIASPSGNPGDDVLITEANEASDLEERLARANKFYLQSALFSLSIAYGGGRGVRLSKKEVIALSLALGHEPR